MVDFEFKNSISFSLYCPWIFELCEVFQSKFFSFLNIKKITNYKCEYMKCRNGIQL